MNNDCSKAVAAFNAITGHTLTEQDGVLFVAIMKLVSEFAPRDHAAPELKEKPAEPVPAPVVETVQIVPKEWWNQPPHRPG